MYFFPKKKKYSDRGILEIISNMKHEPYSLEVQTSSIGDVGVNLVKITW